jgi:Flp pilus assembly protein TadB
MHSQDDQEKELRRREEELQKRELDLRLRILEDEINKTTPLHQTTKHQEGKKALQRRMGTIGKVATFLALVVVVAIAVKVAFYVASIFIVAGIAWIAYKIFFDNKKSKK